VVEKNQTNNGTSYAAKSEPLLTLSIAAHSTRNPSHIRNLQSGRVPSMWWRKIQPTTVGVICSRKRALTHAIHRSPWHQGPPQRPQFSTGTRNFNVVEDNQTDNGTCHMQPQASPHSRYPSQQDPPPHSGNLSPGQETSAWWRNIKPTTVRVICSQKPLLTLSIAAHSTHIRNLRSGRATSMWWRKI
jgi:hypothetical protein